MEKRMQGRMEERMQGGKRWRERGRGKEREREGGRGRQARRKEINRGSEKEERMNDKLLCVKGGLTD